MARRSDHNNEELKALAISKACKLIALKGDEGFKARDIAKEMGYTVGTIYYLFDSMEQLRYHVAGWILDHFYDEIRSELTKKKNKLNYHTTKYLQIARDHPNYSSFLYAYKARPRENIPDWYLQKYERHFSLFAETIDTRIKDPQTAKRAAKVIWVYIHGICILSVYEKLPMMRENKPEIMVRHMVSTYLDGLSV